jgi:hypothetical protein
MGKKKNKNKGNNNNANKTIEHIPSVGFQTAHFKSKNRPYHPNTRPIELVNLAHPETVNQMRRQMAIQSGQQPLPAAPNFKMSNFTVKNYSTCRPTGLPQMPGTCPLCNEYYFDVTPHLWSFHEIDLPNAQRIATTGSL